MAKLQEEVIGLKLTKLVRDTDKPSELISEITLSEIEAVVQEMIGDTTILVEVVRG